MHFAPNSVKSYSGSSVTDPFSMHTQTTFSCVSCFFLPSLDFFQVNKTIPTILQMKNICTMNWTTHEVSKSILCWCVHNWLPVLVVTFDRDTHLTNLPTATAGTVCASHPRWQMEACGLMLCKNDHQNWKAICDKSDTQGSPFQASPPSLQDTLCGIKGIHHMQVAQHSCRARKGVET